MKCFTLILIALLFACSAHGAVIYSGEQNISVPQNFDGIYLNVVTGSTSISNSPPGDWTTAPWINPIFGGVSLGGSELLRLATDGSNRAVNQAIGAIIDNGDTFAIGESGSTTHVGPAGDQFQLNAQGLLGFVMQTTTGGPLRYGWMLIAIKNTGAGNILDWAYDDSATSIQAGWTGATLVPEPSRAILLLLSFQFLLQRRLRQG
jgi:hypothetical protein